MSGEITTRVHCTSHFALIDPLITVPCPDKLALSIQLRRAWQCYSQSKWFNLQLFKLCHIPQIVV